MSAPELALALVVASQIDDGHTVDDVAIEPHLK